MLLGGNQLAAQNPDAPIRSRASAPPLPPLEHPHQAEEEDQNASQDQNHLYRRPDHFRPHVPSCFTLSMGLRMSVILIPNLSLITTTSPRAMSFWLMKISTGSPASLLSSIT